ncbi:hypothetical protein K3495_g5991 [Podosphaera aphanis]|nr:hypothetical protein K3495_g5991 [Podosphaera aphanis]
MNEAWLAIIHAIKEEDHIKKLAAFKSHKTAAKCCIGTWLRLWKEKTVNIPVLRYLL